MTKLSGACARVPVKKVSGRHGVTKLTSQYLQRKWLATMLFAALLTLCAPVVTHAETEDPLAQYQVLQWTDLVAEDWEAPLLLTAEEVASPSIDKSSLVPELDQKLVALPGFMRPAVKEGTPVLAHDHEHDHEHLSAGMEVTEFLLVPFLPKTPCQHALWDPNQVVYVNLLEPVLVDSPDKPVWVIGTITLDNIMTDDGLSAYRIVNAVTTEYKN